MRRKPILIAGIAAIAIIAVWAIVSFRAGQTDSHVAGLSGDDTIVLRAWGVPDQISGGNVDLKARLAIIDEFQKRNPTIKPVPTTGLQFAGGRTRDMTPLMQIAGDIAPDVLDVNFRQSDTYIRNKFLYPLDRYVEDLAGVHVPNGHLLENEQYLEILKRAPRWDTEFADRTPPQTWAVMRRACPYGRDCDYLRNQGVADADIPERHLHTWCFPQETSQILLLYRKDLFYEANLDESRVPETMEELLDTARKLTNPAENRYGLAIDLANIGWSTLGFLYSEGGRVVTQNPDGEWVCSFDDRHAVDAYYYVARLFGESYDTPQGRQTGVIYVQDASNPDQARVAMRFAYLNADFFSKNDPNVWGFGPMPANKEGKRGSEFNAMLTGIYAGLADNERMRDASWKYIRWYGSPEAARIKARVFVEEGFGRFVEKKLLEETGYTEYISQIPAGAEQARADALRYGVPEPYGRNCQQVYRYVSMAVDQIRNDGTVKAAIARQDEAAARDRIATILKDRVRLSNEKMLNIFTPEQRRTRNTVASLVVGAILIIFFFVFRHVYRLFARRGTPEAGPGSMEDEPPQPPLPWPRLLLYRLLHLGRKPPARGLRKRANNWQFMRYAWGYILLIPAVGSIALWEYYPLARGTVMAFQDYNVRGFSEYVGMENFANVLFDPAFWHSMLVSVKYSLLFMLFGFGAPIILAFLLTEVPRGKLLYRTIYYLPAVLSGVVVIFLWKGFYGRYGMINQVLNWGVSALNYLGASIEPFRKDWLGDPGLALLFCLLPVIWAGMGPGCLIYLAALKTVPEELYEAADIDGAGIWHKLFHIAIPSIKGLIMINFIGVMIGTIKGGSTMVLAMTGGGPYSPYGSTEVIGLHIFWQAYGYLRFGAATAMAWVLGAMLIGFTVMQLTKLSRMEFKRAGA